MTHQIITKQQTEANYLLLEFHSTYSVMSGATIYKMWHSTQTL